MNTLITNPIKTFSDTIESAVSKGISYEAYRELVTAYAIEGKTTGEQKEAYIKYTQLNDRRMKRWDKTFKIPEDVQNKISKVSEKVTWLVITESWCGDAAHSMPIMHAIAKLNPHIVLKVVLRDENLALMDLFLTDGAQSIPKLIALKTDTLEIIGEWGPRPSIATTMVKEYKAQHGKLTPEFKEDLQLWYNKEKGKNILDDLLQLLPLK